MLAHLGPPKALWEWFEEHPDGYDFFRAQYHDALGKGAYKPALEQLARAGMRETFTLLHQGEDPGHNSATALHEYLTELEAWCQRDE